MSTGTVQAVFDGLGVSGTWTRNQGAGLGLAVHLNGGVPLALLHTYGPLALIHKRVCVRGVLGHFPTECIISPFSIIVRQSC